MLDRPTALDAQVQAILDEPRSRNLIGREVVRAGPAHVATALRLLDERAELEHLRIRSCEMQVHIHLAAKAWPQAEEVLIRLAEDGQQGRKAVARIIQIVSASGNVTTAERLLALALALAPDCRPIQRAAEHLERKRADRAFTKQEEFKFRQGETEATTAGVKAARGLGRQFDWDGASALVEACIAEHGSSVGLREARGLARLYAETQDPTEPAGDPLPGLDVRYINLDAYADRRERLEASLAACGLSATRSAGVHGARLPRLVSQRVAPSMPNLDHAVLGIFLSHLRVWELVASSQRPSLVLEDDGLPCFRLRSALEGLVGDVRDVCFVNDRMSNKLKPMRPHPDRFGVVPLAGLASAFTGPASAPGADGYILTPEGARKLLIYVAEDGCIGHVDVQILSYGLSLEDYDAGIDGGQQQQLLGRYWKRHQGARQLDADIVYPPLTEHRDLGRSTRAAL